MKKPAVLGSENYLLSLNALREGDTGQAFILARNGLLQAQKENDPSATLVYQGLFASIHLEDQDPASARRAWKLMKPELEKMPSDERPWGAAQISHLEELIENA